MDALVFDGPAPDSSRTAVRRMSTPRPGPGQVLLEVAHAAVNFKDVMARRGDADYVDNWPFVPGLEAAGTVVATGTGVTSICVGNRVAALTNAGGLAEYALASAELAAVIPDTVCTAVAAIAPGALTTAALLVEQFGRVRDGDVVMVHSAAGAVGTAVAAIARTLPGVVLIGTVGDDTRTAAARAAGYDHVLTRRLDLADRVSLSLARRGVDVVLDPQGTAELDTDLAVLSAGGRIVIFGNAAGAAVDDLNAESDPAAMADLAQGRMRAKIDQLTEALTGRFNDHHRFMVTFRHQRIDQTNADIARLDRRIDELIADHGYTAAVDLLASIPGLGKHGSQELLAEIGADMSVFASPANLASWVGVAPGSHESAGVKKRVKTRPGNRYAKRALGIAAMSAARSKSTFLSARFRRIRARQGYGKALVATQHSIVTAIWHILSNGDYYRDLGVNYYDKRTPERTLRRKIKDLEAAGYDVTKAA